MTDLVDTRIVEVGEGEWVVQFEGGFGWSQMGATFTSQSEAQEFLNDQIGSADLECDE